MAEFTIDGATYETDNLDDTQKGLLLCIRKLSLKLNPTALEMKRAARIELGRKLKELVIDKKEDKGASKKK